MLEMLETIIFAFLWYFFIKKKKATEIYSYAELHTKKRENPKICFRPDLFPESQT